jgi:hypothetical protein
VILGPRERGYRADWGGRDLFWDMVVTGAVSVLNLRSSGLAGGVRGSTGILVGNGAFMIHSVRWVTPECMLGV